MTFDLYKKDIEKLVFDGNELLVAMLIQEYPKDKEVLTEERLKTLPDFSNQYQIWYSEAVSCVSQLLPERLEDFTSYYKPPRNRKDLDSGNYTISDYLRGLSRPGVVNKQAAVLPFQQQVNIVISLQNRFESSLFDIRALVQADLYDDEVDAAGELNKKGFHRGAGAIVGVVLEGHLRTICEQHKVTARKTATLGKLNDLLKENSVLDIPTWRFIQHLIDLRNLCDHKKAKNPTEENIEELIEGVRKVTKTVY